MTIKNFLRAVLPLLLLAASPIQAAVGTNDLVKGSIVKIFTVFNKPDYYNPWSMRGPASATGSGCIIKGRKILTNAHVVSDQTFIQVRRNGESRRFQARVLAVAHEVDLALLTVDEPGFFDNATPLEFGELPQAQQEVLVYGYPLGGDTLSITKGVISRIEHTTYAHSSMNFMAVQIDAAINPGNSGGPAIVNGRIVGVAMQGIQSADNIGFIAPVPIIQHVMKDLEDGHYNGFPSLGISVQDMESPALRRKYGLKEDGRGVLISRVTHQSSADGELQPGDVLLALDDQPVANDETVEFRPNERTRFAWLIQKHQVGDPLKVEVWRDGRLKKLSILLKNTIDSDLLVPLDKYDVQPSYYIYGGVVFCPLSANLLKIWGPNWMGNAPRSLVDLLTERNFITPDRDQVVIALKVLASEATEGYHTLSSWEVHAVNDQPVRNLRDLVEKIEKGNDPYVIFTNKMGIQLVLDRNEVKEKERAILELYRVRYDRSDDLRQRQAP